MEDWKYDGNEEDIERVIRELRLNIEWYGFGKVFKGEEESKQKLAMGFFLLKAHLSDEVFAVIDTLPDKSPVPRVARAKNRTSLVGLNMHCYYY
jgi:hypothetical protein